MILLLLKEADCKVVIMIVYNMELDDLRIIICLRKSEVTVEKIQIVIIIIGFLINVQV